MAETARVGSSSTCPSLPARPIRTRHAERAQIFVAEAAGRGGSSQSRASWNRGTAHRPLRGLHLAIVGSNLQIMKNATSAAPAASGRATPPVRDRRPARRSVSRPSTAGEGASGEPRPPAAPRAHRRGAQKPALSQSRRAHLCARLCTRLRFSRREPSSG